MQGRSPVAGNNKQLDGSIDDLILPHRPHSHSRANVIDRSIAAAALYSYVRLYIPFDCWAPVLLVELPADCRPEGSETIREQNTLHPAIRSLFYIISIYSIRSVFLFSLCAHKKNGKIERQDGGRRRE